MDYFYNYQKIQEALYQSQIKVMKKDKERYLYALIICACVFISLGIYSYCRRREKEIKPKREAGADHEKTTSKTISDKLSPDKRRKQTTD